MKLLDEKLREFGMPVLYSKDDRITKEYKNDAFDRLLMQLLDKQFGYYTLIKRIYKDKMSAQIAEREPMKKKTTLQVATPLAETVVVDGDMSIGYFFCPECRPSA